MIIHVANTYELVIHAMRNDLDYFKVNVASVVETENFIILLISFPTKFKLCIIL